MPQPERPEVTRVSTSFGIDSGRLFDLESMAADLSNVLERQEHAKDGLRERWKLYYAQLDTG